MNEVTTCFGQLVIGPPGSGKTTYCAAMSNLLESLGRKVTVINLDSANDTTNYTPNVDVRELVTLDDIMSSLKLGPNGGLIYSLECLLENSSWLIDSINSAKGYIIIDCPGQIELYTHHYALRQLIDQMQRKCDLRLTAVHLVDSHYCSDSAKFVAAVLTSLSAMLQLELPHINVLSKIDIAEEHEMLYAPLHNFTELTSLQMLLDADLNREQPNASSSWHKRYEKLTRTLAEVVEDYAIVDFQPLCAYKRDSLLQLLERIDKSNGFVFNSSSASKNDSSMPLDQATAAFVAKSSAEDYGPALQEQYWNDED